MIGEVQTPPNRWQSVRTVIELTIAGLLMWTGNTLLAVHTKMSAVETEMRSIGEQLEDLPSMRNQLAEMRVRLDRNTQDIRDIEELLRSKP